MSVFKKSVLLTFLMLTSISFSQEYDYTSLLDSVNLDNIKMHIDSLCIAGGHQSRVTYTEGNHYAGHYIARYLETIPGVHVTKDTFYIENATPPYDSIPQFNVSANIYGVGFANSLVLMGAHYDASGSRDNNYDANWQTIRAQGADDNATGVAIIMEAARVLANADNGYLNVASYKFVAYAAEEYHPMHPNDHHVGSLFDAKNMHDNNEPLKAAIVVDMIGYNDNLYTEVISDNFSKSVADTAYNMRDLYVPDLDMNGTPANVPYSDHDSYWFYGYKAILFMENDRPWNNDPPDYIANPYYHTSGDTRNKLNYELVNKVAKLALATAARHGSVRSVSDVEEQNDLAATDFKLQAYPNPFNPEVNLHFKYNSKEPVTLEIYNSIGQKIESLLINEQVSNLNSVKWNASKYTSGVYFARLYNSERSESIKLMLLK